MKKRIILSIDPMPISENYKVLELAAYVTYLGLQTDSNRIIMARG